MNNTTEIFVRFVDPQAVIEITEKIKAMEKVNPVVSDAQVLVSLGEMTNRDLFFYFLGKHTGLALSETAFRSTFHHTMQEKSRMYILEEDQEEISDWPLLVAQTESDVEQAQNILAWMLTIPVEPHMQEAPQELD